MQHEGYKGVWSMLDKNKKYNNSEGDGGGLLSVTHKTAWSRKHLDAFQYIDVFPQDVCSFFDG